MSIEVEVGKITRDIFGAAADSAASNLAQLLKREGLSDDQITRAISVMRSSIETVGFNGVQQYVSLFARETNDSTASKKNKFFG